MAGRISGILDQRIKPFGRKSYLTDLASKIGGLQVETIVRTGNASEQIIGGVDDPANVVIVMISHGVSGIRCSLVGTVTTRVVHGARCAVVVVPSAGVASASTESLTFDNIQIALDGSPYAECAKDVAVPLFPDGNLSVHLVRVIEIPYWFPIDVNGAGYYDRFDAYLGYMHDDVRDYLSKVASTLEARGCSVTWELRDGIVHRELEAAAAEQCPDLIGLSTHGRSGARRALIGSVAERVARCSRTPVKLVHPAATLPCSVAVRLAWQSVTRTL